jgi:hypothetical protein
MRDGREGKMAPKPFMDAQCAKTDSFPCTSGNISIFCRFTPVGARNESIELFGIPGGIPVELLEFGENIPFQQRLTKQDDILSRQMARETDRERKANT